MSEIVSFISGLIGRYKPMSALDRGFVLILLILCATSCFAIYNSFNLVSYGLGPNYLLKQIMWYGAGFIMLLLIRCYDNKQIFRFLNYFYVFLIGTLVYLLLSKGVYSISGGRFNLPFASPVNGAISWIQIPGLGSFQPSEFIKVVLIVQTAQMIFSYQKNYPKPTIKDDMMLFVRIGIITLPPWILILMQPDTGLCFIIAFTIIVLLCCSGIRKGYIWTLLLLIAAVLGLFVYLYMFQKDWLSALTGYRLTRIEAWLDPDSHIRGSSNQLYTALLSLGSAGLSGHGLQANIISIPEAHTDFIFAAFGQCFGLVGTTGILLICAVMDIYLILFSNRLEERTDRLIVIGVVAMLFYQQFQNMGMIVGLLPITGITLPLISYGGSSILSYFIAFGIILNMKEKKNRKMRT
jgi:rod shape determining protein RodA